MNFKQDLYSRFKKYVQIDTQSLSENEKDYPSTPGQLVFGKMLVKEMEGIGLSNVHTDKYGYVMAELPGNTKKSVPVIGLLAHMDTSEEESGRNVVPQIHEKYDGKDIIISRERDVILSPGDSPELLNCLGHDIITAGGDTLLGADNKAGIAIIMTAMDYLIKNSHIEHGTVKIAFTPDEETGRGVQYFDVKKFGADYAYTIDGDILGAVEDETFNADAINLEIKGKSYHPGNGKGLLVNAVRIAADIISSWPENMLPESTEGREGYILFNRIEGATNHAKVCGAVRDHDLEKLKAMEEHLKAIAGEKRLKYPGTKIELTFKEQYRNMKEVLDKHPQVMQKLLAALEKKGITPVRKPVRGGTDGSRLSYMGLPTPNIFTGGSNFHGKYEWISIDDMAKSTEVIISLLKEWEKGSK